MGLPMLHRCCGCLSLEHGSIILAIVSLAMCIADITVGASSLPRKDSRAPGQPHLHEHGDVRHAVGCLQRAAARGHLYAPIGVHATSDAVQRPVRPVQLLGGGGHLPLQPRVQEGRRRQIIDITFTIIGTMLALTFCAYYFLVVNSLYRKMKMTYGDTAIPIDISLHSMELLIKHSATAPRARFDGLFMCDLCFFGVQHVFKQNPSKSVYCDWVTYACRPTTTCVLFHQCFDFVCVGLAADKCLVDATAEPNADYGESSAGGENLLRVHVKVTKHTRILRAQLLKCGFVLFRRVLGERQMIRDIVRAHWHCARACTKHRVLRYF
ncbi:hypothetical protein EVAR_24702_1 [Eumeta japonica]|uniref:Uncharacterized protein n=1 Tax=Eumeta variegata TaxID=151549 RepID=A0A4C1WGY8_EUMVA|nr:hypothetical protein EVAR_24702_1 [Eumeta japonica]